MTNCRIGNNVIEETITEGLKTQINDSTENDFKKRRFVAIKLPICRDKNAFLIGTEKPSHNYLKIR